MTFDYLGFSLRQFSILFTLSLTVFSGCSSQFERYTLTQESETASTSYRSARVLTQDNKTRAILSTIFLNDIYPKYTDGRAHFLVAFYSPEQNNTLYFQRARMPDEKASVLLLNGKEALASEDLDNDDMLIDLLPVSNDWNRYYYVRYEMPNETPVLVLESDHTEQAVIRYQTAQE